MNDKSRLLAITLSIAAVERDTGLSKDTLRVWERRYGFPAPGRDRSGERAYTLAAVEKLRLIKRLLDAGQRPGCIVPLALDALQSLTEQTVDQPLRTVETVLGMDGLRACIALIREHDAARLRRELIAAAVARRRGPFCQSGRRAAECCRGRRLAARPVAGF